MCKCYQLIEQCRSTNEKTEKKAMEERGFVPARHETLHLLQWMLKHFKQHHGMKSSRHHARSRGGGSPWSLTTSHKCNVLDQEPKDGGGLT